MLQQTKNYKIQVTMTLDEFIQFGDAIKAHLTRMSPFSLCGNMLRIPKIWINKSNFDVFHPAFSDYTELIGESEKFIYYALPCIKSSIHYYLRGCALSYDDVYFNNLVVDYIYSLQQ